MALTDTTRVTKRVDAILLASPLATPYSGSVLKVNGQPNTARYPSNDEILDAILEADAVVCTTIIQAPGHPFAATFFVTSSALANGDAVPAHVGVDGVNIVVDDIAARSANSRNEILEIRANAILYPDAAAWYWLEQGVLWHTGTSATIDYPDFSISTACQSPDNYEAAVIAGAVSLLMKDGGSSDYYSYYTELFAKQIALIAQQETIVPEVSQYEEQAA